MVRILIAILFLAPMGAHATSEIAGPSSAERQSSTEIQLNDVEQARALMRSVHQELELIKTRLNALEQEREALLGNAERLKVKIEASEQP